MLTPFQVFYYFPKEAQARDVWAWVSQHDWLACQFGPWTLYLSRKGRALRDEQFCLTVELRTREKAYPPHKPDHYEIS